MARALGCLDMPTLARHGRASAEDTERPLQIAQNQLI